MVKGVKVIRTTTVHNPLQRCKCWCWKAGQDCITVVQPRQD